MKKAAAILALMVSWDAMADTTKVEQTLKRLYPKTQFTSITSTPMPNLYEVVMGKNIAYVQEDGRYFIFGAMYDMETQRDLTALRKADIDRVAFQDLPLKQAIKISRGNGGKGKRVFTLFSDPDCPFCRRLEETLAGMNDFTAYVFVYPIQSLHSESVATAGKIYCSTSPKQAWLDYMLLGKKPNDGSKTCQTPVQANIDLASRLGINGTPTMIHIDGRRTAGAMPRAELENWLGGAL